MENYSDVKNIELEKWRLTNQQLRRHELTTIKWCDADYPPDNPDNNLCICVDQSELLRQTILKLMSDCNKREDFIEELIESNKQIREKIACLELKDKNQEMKCRMESLKNGHSYSEASQNRPLDESYQKLTEDKFQEMSRSYELEISRLNGRLDNMSTSSTSSTSVERFKRKSIKTSDKKYAELSTKYGRLQDENEILKLEICSRPEMKEHRNLQMRIRQLQRMVKENSRTPRHQKGDNNLSTKVCNINALPLETCQSILKNIVDHLEVTDLNQIQGRLCGVKVNSERLDRYETFLRSVEEILPLEHHTIGSHIRSTQMNGGAAYPGNTNNGGEDIRIANMLSRLTGFMSISSTSPHAPPPAPTATTATTTTTMGAAPRPLSSPQPPPPLQPPSPLTSSPVRLARYHNNEVATLRDHIDRLLCLLSPQLRLPLASVECGTSPVGRPLNPSPSPPPPVTLTLDALRSAVAALCNDLEAASRGTCINVEPQSLQKYDVAELRRIVSHVMSLFDINSAAAIYASVSLKHRHHRELLNATSVLKDLLGLDLCKATIHDVVTAVTTVLRCLDTATDNGRYRPTEIKSLLRQNSEQGQFLNAFQQMIEQLFIALDVTKIDEIVPAVYHLLL